MKNPWNRPDDETYLDCPKCGKFRHDSPALPSNCPTCGRALEYLAPCQKCGENIYVGTDIKQCPKCGHNLLELSRAAWWGNLLVSVVVLALLAYFIITSLKKD